jgi:hypothetical protein
LDTAGEITAAYRSAIEPRLEGKEPMENTARAGALLATAPIGAAARSAPTTLGADVVQPLPLAPLTVVPSW